LSKKTTLIALSVSIVILSIIIIANFTTDSIGGSASKENYTEKVSSLHYFNQPVQTDTTGETTVRISSTNVKLTYVAKYSISGRAVVVKHYRGGTRNDLAPVDVALAWDILADKKVDEKIEWGTPQSRFYSYYVTDGQWLNSIGGLDKIAHNSANCHLIPADNNIKKLIKSIEEGDYVKIEGYLVNVYWETITGGYYYMNTSTTRTDTGAGACEIIYVTGIKWLEL